MTNQPKRASRRPVASVIGDAKCNDKTREQAYALGRGLIDANFRIITGGAGGVMLAAGEGARASKKYQDGDVIGVLKGYNADAANESVDIAICTGMEQARNVIVVASGDVVFALGGSSGTLSEIALAATLEKPTACVGDCDGWANRLAGMQINRRSEMHLQGPFDPVQAVAWAKERVKGGG